ncbi:MAG TPA: TraC family protein [Candidatus Saccharimonadales bacterium]|nr:TraC family protein [Candidatus Saccharimonadales bacterium]
MFLLQKSKNKTDSRKQIDIKGVKDQVLMLPGNQYRSVLHVSSVNFELKSEDEQDILIDTFESFLNSVGCPLQILIRTREIDMDKYLGELNERLNGETEAIYRTQLQNYDEFIRSLITTNKILTRHFYVVIPYDADPKLEFELVKEQLNLRADIVTKGLGRLGMQARELSSLEILDLFYSFYSPEQAKIQPLTDHAVRLVHSSYIKKGQDDE